MVFKMYWTDNWLWILKYRYTVHDLSCTNVLSQSKLINYIKKEI